MSLLGKAHTLVDVIKYHVEKHPDAPAYTYLAEGEKAETQWTYIELDQHARAVAAELQKVTKPGDRAVLLYPSGLEFIATFLGCMYAGVIAVPSVLPHLKRATPRLKAILADAGAKVACTTNEVYANIEPFIASEPELSSLQWIRNQAIPLEQSKQFKPYALDENAICFLQYTSGSTSAPKGVMISHFNLIRTIEDIVIGLKEDEHDVIITWLPIFHDMGLIMAVLSPLFTGFPCYIMSPVSFLERPARWLEAITKYGGTITAAPNFAYGLCVRKVSEEEKSRLDLHTLRVAINAAEPVRAETIEEFTQTFKERGFKYNAFVPAYGLAEATVKASTKDLSKDPAILTLNTTDLEEHKISFANGSEQNQYRIVGCGVSHIGADIRIVNPDTQNVCAKDEVGEIWIKSDSIAQGYWNQPKATQDTFQAYTANTHEGPFMRTGDLGFIYDGEVYIGGRIKDMIIIQGRNFYPQDIELTVEKSHEALRPSCCAAFAVTMGGVERLAIVQEIRREYRNGEKFDEVLNAIRSAIAKDHGLRAYAVALIRPGSIQKTTSGKIQRHASREAFMNGELEIIAEWRAPLAAPDQHQTG